MSSAEEEAITDIIRPSDPQFALVRWNFEGDEWMHRAAFDPSRHRVARAAVDEPFALALPPPSEG